MTESNGGHDPGVSGALLFRGPCDAGTARQVRRQLRDLLDDAVGVAAGLGADLELLATELITNAVRAGATVVQVHLAHPPPSYCLQVSDDAPGDPVRGRAAADAPNGRGLQIIADLSIEWGVSAARTGKTVWARLAG